ncbi:hypothetical protein CYMTET_56366 [Cymbomonas tetramitiformis]|uniref:Uncharacterized protein n=1 Tax=Cymbomonas tetramitiformis TaxID=36881 RepID=A0AAE0EML8_9CHLO|nr:hypothetical protein CYMTET_56366 [Cymbomonas tetramitiformis]
MQDASQTSNLKQRTGGAALTKPLRTCEPRPKFSGVSRTSRRKQMDLAAYAAALVAVACYTNSLSGEFVFDDLRAITGNPDVLPSTPISNLLINDWWGRSLFSMDSHKSFRPLSVLSFRLNYLFGQLHPIGYHIANVALHAIASAQVVHVTRRIVGFEPVACAIAGLLFAVHPVHVEAVASVVGRAEVLCACLFFAAFLSFCRCVDVGCQHAGGGASAAYLGLTLTFVAAATLAKETGITAVALCFVYDMCHTAREMGKSSRRNGGDNWQRAAGFLQRQELTSEEWNHLSLTGPPEPLCNCAAGALLLCL